MEDISIEKIMSLAALMGQKTSAEEVSAAMNAAQKISMFMNAQQQHGNDDEAAVSVQQRHELPAAIPPTATHVFLDTQSRRMKAINAVLPLLNSEYQKSIFLALKLMECINFQPESVITVMEKGASNERQLKIINTVESYLTNEEKQNMRIFLNAVKASSVMR